MSDRAEEQSFTAEAAPLMALSHPDHVWLYDYWRRRKPKDGLPSRSEIDPADFPRMLPRIAVIAAEPVGGGFAYRYRLAGTEIVARAGRDPTGKTFEELYEGDYLDSARALYEEVRQTAEPHFSQRVYPIGDGESFLRYDRLILPLASDHDHVDQFLLLIVVVEQGGAVRHEGSFERAGKTRTS